MSALGLENLEKIALDHVKAERQELLEEGIDTLKTLMKKNLGQWFNAAYLHIVA